MAPLSEANDQSGSARMSLAPTVSDTDPGENME
jgi:hypothetical protein